MSVAGSATGERKKGRLTIKDVLQRVIPIHRPQDLLSKYLREKNGSDEINDCRKEGSRKRERTIHMYTPSSVKVVHSSALTCHSALRYCGEQTKRKCAERKTPAIERHQYNWLLVLPVPRPRPRAF